MLSNIFREFLVAGLFTLFATVATLAQSSDAELLQQFCAPSDIRGSGCLNAKGFSQGGTACNVEFQENRIVGKYISPLTTTLVIPYGSDCIPRAMGGGGSAVFEKIDGKYVFRGFHVGNPLECVSVPALRNKDRLVCIQLAAAPNLVEISFAAKPPKNIVMSDNILVASGGNLVDCPDTLELKNKDLSALDIEDLSKLEVGSAPGTVSVWSRYYDLRAVAAACAPNAKVPNGMGSIPPGVEKEGRLIIDLNTGSINPAAQINEKKSTIDKPFVNELDAKSEVPALPNDGALVPHKVVTYHTKGATNAEMLNSVTLPPVRTLSPMPSSGAIVVNNITTKPSAVAPLIPLAGNSPIGGASSNGVTAREIRAAALNARGDAYYGKGQIDLAINKFDEAIKLAPGFARAFNGRGMAYIGKAQFDRAIQDFDQAIKLSPQFAEGFNLRGFAYTAKGQFDRAIQDFDWAIGLKPHESGFFYNRGVAYSSRGVWGNGMAIGVQRLQDDHAIQDFDHAIQDYDQALKLNPDGASVLNGYLNEAYNLRGKAYASKGHYDRAIQDFDQAIKVNPYDPSAFISRGKIYNDKGQTDLAIQDFDKAITLNPKNAETFYNRGIVKKKKGDEIGVAADIATAKSINPNIGR